MTSAVMHKAAWLLHLDPSTLHWPVVQESLGMNGAQRPHDTPAQRSGTLAVGDEVLAAVAMLLAWRFFSQ